jgi:nucleoside-diphosphate-sugar epimerase
MAIIALMAMLLLTGATGFLGSWILEQMRQEETCRKLGFDTLRLMVRRPEKLAQAPLPGTRLEVRQGDLLEPESVRSAAQAADAVLHVAALYDTHSPWRTFYRSNVEATRALVSGMKAGSSLVLTSTYGVYGFPNAGRPITEDYEPKRPLWHYQRTKWLQEQEARALCRERGIRFVALRPPTVIGPREMLSIPSWPAPSNRGPWCWSGTAPTRWPSPTPRMRPAPTCWPWPASRRTTGRPSTSRAFTPPSASMSTPSPRPSERRRCAGRRRCGWPGS